MFPRYLLLSLFFLEAIAVLSLLAYFTISDFDADYLEALMLLLAAQAVFIVLLAAGWVRYARQTHSLEKQLSNTVSALKYQQKEYQKQLTQLHQHAQAASQNTADPRHNSSHFDTRQPLYSLATLMETISSEIDEPQVRSLFDKTQQSVIALTGSLEALLDISRLNSGALAPEFKSFSLVHLLSDLQSEFDTQVKEKKLNFHLEINQLEQMQLYSDQKLLMRVLRQILLNSLKFTSQGQIEIQCQPAPEGFAQAKGLAAKFSGQHIRDYIEINIRDTGAGIQEVQQKDILEALQKEALADAGQIDGLGLGLSIVKRLADLLYLHVNLRSHAGWGTTFSLSVPILSHAKSSSSQKTDKLPKNSDVKVLVIEDEYAVRILTSKLLEGWGYEVMATDSTEQALQQLDNTGFMPTLIVSDYHLYEHTGIEAIKTIQTHLRKDLPGMLVTGNREQAVIDAAEELGYKVLHKPVKPEYLHQLVKSCIQTAVIDAQQFDSLSGNSQP